MQVTLNEAQAETLRDLMADNMPSDLTLTQQGASVYVAFVLASYDIDAEGNAEEAG